MNVSVLRSKSCSYQYHALLQILVVLLTLISIIGASPSVSNASVLSVRITGAGAGSITSDPSGLSCTTWLCTGDFPLHAKIELNAVVARDSEFTGWIGECSGNGSCTVFMDSDKFASAGFALTPRTVKQGSQTYASVTDAYAAASDGSDLLMKSLVYPQELILDRNIKVALRGGFNADFTEQTGLPTILTQPVTVRSGCLTVDRIIVASPNVPVQVPDVVGKLYSDAVTALSYYDLLVGTVGSSYSESVPQGAIATQNPAAYELAARGGYVDLDESIGRSELLITTTPAPASAGQPYFHQFAATGGNMPYSWGLVAGAVPDGLTLSHDGVISGTPSLPGISDFTIMATGVSGGIATREFRLVVTPRLKIFTDSLPTVSTGTFYTQRLYADGGIAPYRWSISSGELPSGLVISEDGTIAGTPTGAMLASVTVMATDSRGATAQQKLSILVLAPSYVGYQSNQDANPLCDGRWDTAACWVPSGIPSATSAWTIRSGDTITITDTRILAGGTVGTTRADGVGTLVLASTANVTLAGPLVLASDVNQKSHLRMEGGARLDIGSTTLTLGTGTSGNSGWWRFEVAGTAAHRATVTGTGRMNMGYLSASKGSISWNYADFIGLGGGGNTLILAYSSNVSHCLFKLSSAISFGTSTKEIGPDQDLVFSDNDFRQSTNVMIFTAAGRPLPGVKREFSGNTFYSPSAVTSLTFSTYPYSGGYFSGSGNHFYNWVLVESSSGNNSFSGGSFYLSPTVTSGTSYMLLGNGGTRITDSVFYSENPNNHGINGGKGNFDTDRNEVVGNIFDNQYNADTANTIIPGQHTGTIIRRNIFFVNGMQSVTYGLNGFAVEASNAVHDVEQNTFVMNDDVAGSGLYWEGSKVNDQAGTLSVRNNIFWQNWSATYYGAKGSALGLPDWLDYIDSNTFFAAFGKTTQYKDLLIATYSLEPATPVYVDSTTFTLPGDRTSVYTATRVVKIWNGPYHAVTRVTLSSYDSTSDRTSIQLECGYLAPTLTVVAYQSGQKNPGDLGYGAGDNALAIDPDFIDPTRSITTYTGGTKESFFKAVLARNGFDETGTPVKPSAWSADDLIRYLREGFTPRNQSLRGSGEGGTDIGAVQIWNGPFPLSISTLDVPAAVTGVAYSRTLTARDGTAPIVWSVVGGGLPDGLSLSPSGLLSGFPTTPGSFGFTVRVTDSTGGSADRQFAIVVVAVLGHQAYQSRQSDVFLCDGHWSNPNCWNPIGIPGQGDTAVIRTGDVMTVDRDVIVGNSATAVGHAITIQGGGRLSVNEGVTLTLRGIDMLNNTAMLINQNGHFEPLPGSVVMVDCVTPFQTQITNNGIISATGTQTKPVTFTIPENRKIFNVGVGTTATMSAYDSSSNLWSFKVTDWISNAAGTGHGSYGDSSLVFTAKPAASLMSEVATLDAVTSPGTYWVDYGSGFIVAYYDGASSLTVSWTAKTLSYNGWGIVVTANTPLNEAFFERSVFAYMGGPGRGVLTLKNKYTPALLPNRNIVIRDCLFSYTTAGMVFSDVYGLPESSIDVTGNSFRYPVGSGNYAAVGTFMSKPNSYLDFSAASIDSGQTAFRAIATGTTTGSDLTGFRFNRINGRFPTLLIGSGPDVEWPGLEVHDCVVEGLGGAVATSFLDGAQGTVSNRVSIRRNVLRHFYRGISFMGHTDIEDNLLERVYNHGVFGATNGVTRPMKVTSVAIRRNLFVGSGKYSGPVIHAGYTTPGWQDDLEVSRNTVSGPDKGLFSFGNVTEAVTTNYLMTRFHVHSNLGYKAGFQRPAESLSRRHLVHAPLFDYNLSYEAPAPAVPVLQASFSKNGKNYNTQVEREVTGVALFSPDSLPVGNHVLSYDATARTLSWDYGTSVPLFLDSGVLSADGVITNVTTSAHPSAGTLTDSTKNWSTTNVGNGPRACWVKMTTGAAAGEIRAVVSNTSSVLTVVPAWSVGRIPAVGDAYEIWKSEVTLPAQDGSKVQAGVYLPELPQTAGQDIDIVLDSHALTENPNLVAPAGLDTSAMRPENPLLAGGGHAGNDIGAVTLATMTSPLVVTSLVLSTGTAGASYCEIFSANGGMPPYTWRVVRGSLPQGMLLYVDGTMSGSPPTPGTFSFDVQVTDSSGAIANRSFMLQVLPVPPPAPRIAVSAFPDAILGVSYNRWLVGVDGVAPYVWSISAGTLPAGLALSADGIISGTPTSAGVFGFTVTLVDGVGQTATAVFVLTVDTSAPSINAVELPNGRIGITYGQPLTVSGGAPSLVWSISSGELPPGLVIDSSGVISGVPTVSGVFNLTVQVKDGFGRLSNRAMRIIINPPLPVVSTAVLPAGIIMTNYNETLAAEGGTPPYRWSVSGGTLPPGIILSSDGKLSGKPIMKGTWPVMFTLSDSANETADRLMEMNITTQPLEVTTVALADATYGAYINQSLTASGGGGGNSWSLVSGILPAGVTFSQGGVLTGTPTEHGVWPIGVRVVDYYGEISSKDLVLTVLVPSLVMTNSTLPVFPVSVRTTATLIAKGGIPPYTWTIISGTLPLGILYQSYSQSIFFGGTPTISGDYPFVLLITDSISNTLAVPLVMSVH